MATSPRSELRVVSITEFNLNPDVDEWFWTTKAANGEPVGGSAGEGYGRLTKAVSGFFAQQGFDPNFVVVDENPYSKLVKISDTEYHIRKYAYGAPDPFDPREPSALAEAGWVPPHAKDAKATPHE